MIQTTCPACQGFGFFSDEHGVLSCQTCNGNGTWLQDDSGHVLTFQIPTIIEPENIRRDQVQRIVRGGLNGLSFTITGLSLIYLLSRGEDPFWGKGIAHALLGISGLTSMWAISHMKQQSINLYSLHSLATNTQKQSTVNLFSYSNPRISRLLSQAAVVAQEYHSDQIDDSLLLITLLRQPRIQSMLARLELSPKALETLLTPYILRTEAGNVQSVTLQSSARLRFVKAAELAIQNQFPYIDLEDLLLAYTEEPGPFAPAFKELTLTKQKVYAVARWYAGEEERRREWSFLMDQGRTRPKGYMNKAWTALPTRFLDQYSQDITQLASHGNLPSAKVREAEIENILQILGRTQKNSLLLVGDPGVGKNTLLGGVALRMVEEQVPEILKDKRLISMDISALLSGGESAEQNIQQVLAEVEQAGNVILAIPDVQVLVGTSGGALDAASILVGALRKGYIQIISTASYADYHRFVESNTNLQNLLEVVQIKELTAEQALEVLEEEATQIEGKQQVFLSYPALEASIELAKRYLTEKPLPSSAISLLDEAASKAKLHKKGWVDRSDVEEIVEEKTNMPVRQAGAEESEKLLHLEDRLHKRVVGQEAGIKAVSDALRRARAGLHNNNRPISSFLFVGPTGVGKTEMAKAVAEVFFGSEESMLRLDMSEYQDNRSVYRLIGAPAAEADSYTEGGSLTQPVREHPFRLILLDELEKANSDVLNLFLQLLDDGRLTENSGRTVHYNNTIIIATSNAGSEEILQAMRQGMSREDLQRETLRLLQTHFKPEFLNRFDAIVPFHPLTVQESQQITSLLLQDVVKEVAQQNYTLEFTPEAIASLTSQGFDPLYGGRPLRRIVQEKVEGLLATKILEHSLEPGQTLQITAEMVQ